MHDLLPNFSLIYCRLCWAKNHWQNATVTTHLPTRVQNLTTWSSAIPVICIEPQNFVMGHMTWPRPYQGQFVVHRLRPTHSTCTSNFTHKRSVVMVTWLFKNFAICRDASRVFVSDSWATCCYWLLKSALCKLTYHLLYSIWWNSNFPYLVQFNPNFIL